MTETKPLNTPTIPAWIEEEKKKTFFKKKLHIFPSPSLITVIHPVRVDGEGDHELRGRVRRHPHYPKGGVGNSEQPITNKQKKPIKIKVQ